MRLTCPADSGNVVLLDATRPDDVTLSIRRDNASPFRQWFLVQCDGVANTRLSLRFPDAGACSYPAGWTGYRAVATYDVDPLGTVDWFRVPTSYVDGALVIDHVPERDTVQYAYFGAYPHARHLARRRHAEAAGARVSTLGTTPDGHPLTLVELGHGPRPVWVIARQHPGETMAEWFVEGLIDRLIAGDPEVEALLDRATIRIVPSMNPDGGKRGNHRTNAHGADLNRMWLDPDPAIAPEVRWVRDRMDQTGVDLALDIHGDEEIPYNFAGGGEGTPSWDPQRAARKDRFVATWIATTPAFQRTHGYPTAGPGEANLAIGGFQITERYSCLALTIEQPFIDDANHPDPVTGWSPRRSLALGASVVTPILAVLA
ncbi:MAG: M14-type cytosolic carboxypeptidase [Myxococcota bacterium]